MKNQEPIKFVSLKKFNLPSGVHFFFTTRQGGRSQGGYGGLNLGLHVGDDPTLVHHNRQQLLTSLPDPVKKLIFVNQVHGTKCQLAPFDEQEKIDADSLVTRQPNLALGIMTADCVPVLLADVQGGVVGAAHAGWRGAIDGVLESTLDKMEALGAQRNRIMAVIGPCIRPSNYEVDSLFRDRFLDNPKNKNHLGCQEFFSSGSDKAIFQFDLPGYVGRRLNWNRVLAENILDVGLCTYLLNNQFFSYRQTTSHGGEHCGRQMGGIFLC
jgi:polyphenol oxidase